MGEKDSPRPARAPSCLLRPAPPVAAVSAAVDDASARQRDVLAADRRDQGRETSRGKTLPGTDHAAAVIAFLQDRPVPPVMDRREFGALCKINRHMRAQEQRTGVETPRRHQKRAAIGHRVDRGLNGGAVVRRFALCAEIQNTDLAGAMAGAEFDRPERRFQAIVRSGLKAVELQNRAVRPPGRGKASGGCFQQEIHRLRQGISCPVGRKKDSCRPRGGGNEGKYGHRLSRG
ncbi:hypothetical protein ACFQEX_22825 [Roseibium salinum]|uniref:hypothetical protein n=1 Tax=Roseibium salinum TaxID=1604349 RepID=UPI00360DF507